MSEAGNKSEVLTNEEKIMNHALEPKIMADFFRDKAKELDIDPKRFIFGYVMSTIQYDDTNYFVYSMFPDQKIDPKNLDIAKKAYLVRLAWEESVPEIPVDLRKRIKVHKKEVEDRAWDSPAAVIETKAAWQQDLKDFIEEQINTKRNYGEARLYFEHKTDKVDAAREQMLRKK